VGRLQALSDWGDPGTSLGTMTLGVFTSSMRKIFPALQKKHRKLKKVRIQVDRLS